MQENKKRPRRSVWLKRRSGSRNRLKMLNLKRIRIGNLQKLKDSKRLKN